MSWQAENIGEFNSFKLSNMTWEADEIEKMRLNMDDSMLVAEHYFNFHSPNDKVDCTLQWLPKSKELIAKLTVMDLDTEIQRTYVGNEELSQPEPSKYMWWLFQKCCEIAKGSKMRWTSATVAGGYEVPTDDEMLEIEKELGFDNKTNQD